MNYKLLLMFTMLLVITAGCGQSRSPSQPSESGEEAPPVQALTASDIRQRVQTTTNAVTLLHFWATWCPPCVHEFPHIVKIQKEFRDQGLDVMLVSMDRETQQDAVQAFLTKHGADGQAYIASSVTSDFLETISEDWSGAIPTSFFYGSDGKRLEWWEGARSYDTYKETVNRLLQQQ